MQVLAHQMLRHEEKNVVSNVGAHSLTMAPLGVPVRVVGFRAGRSVEHRLASMGIHVGSVVQMVCHNCGGFIVAVGNTRLAIAPGVAHKVLIVPEG